MSTILEKENGVGYLVVKNKGPKITTLRHIVEICKITTYEEAIESYYRIFQKLDGDIFYYAKNLQELEKIIETEV